MTTELARAVGPPPPELVERATELARIAHPTAAAVWELAAQAYTDDPDSAIDVGLRARIDEGLEAALTVSDNARARLLLAGL